MKHGENRVQKVLSYRYTDEPSSTAADHHRHEHTDEARQNIAQEHAPRCSPLPYIPVAVDGHDARPTNEGLVLDQTTWKPLGICWWFLESGEAPFESPLHIGKPRHQHG
jgi:hypothetical protein